MNISHNAQEHNNNQTSLQHIGNLSYHKDKSATSYDSINSLTTHNNHYTLLYPDLVHELFTLSLHKNNINTNISHSLGDLACGISTSSSFNSSLNTSLHPQEILFFLQIVSLYQLELSKGNSCITYSSLKLAKLLGFDSSVDENVSALKASNMRSSILKMTSKLETLGLLKVFRSKRNNGVNKVNKIVPILPDQVYNNIRSASYNLKVSNSSTLENESNLDHILKTKLFVPIELEFMKHLFKDDVPAKHKLFFLNCIMTAYRNYRKGNSFSFAATSSGLMNKNNISRSTLDRIFRYVKQQGNDFFLKVEHKYTQSDDIDCNRYDKSIFVLSVDHLVFPSVYIKQLDKANKEENTDIHYDDLQSIDHLCFPDSYKGFETAWSKKPPSIIKKTAHNNKEEIIKNKYNKNIDDIDVKHEEEFLENEQSSFPSKSYKNSSFLNDPCKKTTLRQNVNQKAGVSKSTNKVVLEQEAQQKEQSTIQHNKQNTKRTELVKPCLTLDKAQWLELRNFYPLSEKDISLLNSRANREFSNNFVNQLLLKLYIKYPEKRFKNRFTFLSYMVQILENEKHQGPLVNHTSFRFSCNIGTEEKSLLEYERYLNQIEDTLDLSKEMQLKKKIAGRFSTEVAYKILTKVQFKTNHDNSFITALIPSLLDLSERQTKILGEQLGAVYGINGYYVQEVEEDTIQPPKTKISDIDANEKSTKNLASSNKPSAISEEILENTAWNQIRKTLREELGDHIDQAWFSKAVATECKETKTLTLTMPTRFMADWVRNNYSHSIRRVAGSVGVDFVEYVYE